VILPVDVRDKMHSVLVLGTAESAFAAGALIGAVLYAAMAERLPRWPVFTVGLPQRIRRSFCRKTPNKVLDAGGISAVYRSHFAPGSFDSENEQH
jgi:hypothetical protein